MTGQIPESVKNERSARLIAVTDEMNRKFSESLIRMKRPVLIEEREVLSDGTAVQCGFTPEYIRTAVISGEDLTNRIVDVRISGEGRTGNGRVMIGKIEKNLQ